MTVSTWKGCIRIKYTQLVFLPSELECSHGGLSKRKGASNPGWPAITWPQGPWMGLGHRYWSVFIAHLHHKKSLCIHDLNDTSWKCCAISDKQLFLLPAFTMWNFVLIGLYKSTGVLYIEWLERYGESPSKTMIPGSLFMGVVTFACEYPNSGLRSWFL